MRSETRGELHDSVLIAKARLQATAVVTLLELLLPALAGVLCFALERSAGVAILIVAFLRWTQEASFVWEFCEQAVKQLVVATQRNTPERFLSQLRKLVRYASITSAVQFWALTVALYALFHVIPLVPILDGSGRYTLTQLLVETLIPIPYPALVGLLAAGFISNVLTSSAIKALHDSLGVTFLRWWGSARDIHQADSDSAAPPTRFLEGTRESSYEEARKRAAELLGRSIET